MERKNEDLVLKNLEALLGSVGPPLDEFSSLRDPDSLLELERFLREHPLAIDKDVGCYLYARELLRLGQNHGLLIHIVTAEASEYNRFLSPPLKPYEFHMFNMVIIDDKIYWIEPQTGKIAFRGRVEC